MEGFDSIIPICSVTSTPGVELGLMVTSILLPSVTNPTSIKTFLSHEHILIGMSAGNHNDSQRCIPGESCT